MTIPELPDDLKDLVMFDWYTDLWRRMHQRRVRECGHLQCVIYMWIMLCSPLKLSRGRTLLFTGPLESVA